MFLALPSLPRGLKNRSVQRDYRETFLSQKERRSGGPQAKTTGSRFYTKRPASGKIAAPAATRTDGVPLGTEKRKSPQRLELVLSGRVDASLDYPSSGSRQRHASARTQTQNRDV